MRAQCRQASLSYSPPENIGQAELGELIAGTGRSLEQQRTQGELFVPVKRDVPAVFYAGDVTLLRRPCVAIVGTRKVTPAGAARARRMARELAAAGIVVVSGLAQGVDTVALTAAIEAGGQTVGVIGTPLDRATPTANGPLQERMWREHLLISQFAIGTPVHKAFFPQRNRTMAAVTDGTVIIEASDTSGTLHQAAECTRLGRWLFILESLMHTEGVNWPADFLRYKTTVVVSDSADVIERVIPAKAR